MTRLHLPYVMHDTDRHGNVRYYLRRRGRRKVRLPGRPGSPEFMAAYHAGLAETAPPPGVARIEPGSLRWLVTRYLASPEARDLQPKTRSARRRNLEAICAELLAADDPTPLGDLPFAQMAARHVRLLRDRKAAAPEAANDRLKSLKVLFAWAVAADLAHTNPARDVPKFRPSATGFHTWTPEEVEKYEARWPAGTKARLALDLVMYTGARRSDIIALGRQHERAGWLCWTQAKGRARKPVRVEIPILPALRATLDASALGAMTYLVTEHGRPYSHGGIGNRFKAWCLAAGLPHCSMHGVRKAAACIAAERGATEQQLMAIFGWETAEQARVYTRAANRRRMAGDGMALIWGEG